MNQYKYGNTATLNKPRSKFKQQSSTKTSMNTGDLIPVYLQEIYPGDTIKMSIKQINRLAASYIKSPLDALMLDIMIFNVPNRIIDNSFAKVLGENKNTKWIGSEEIFVPKINFKKDTEIRNVANGELLDYYGIPAVPNGTATNSLPSISAYPIRGYYEIYNEFIRNQNTHDPINYAKDSVDIYYGDSTYFDANKNFGKPLKIMKNDDYFTTCLPGPQKGNAVSILPSGGVPVVTKNDEHGPDPADGAVGMRFIDTGGLIAANKNLITSSGGYLTGENITATSGNSLLPNNLWANIAGANINEFRFAINLQEQLEMDARLGTRLNEIISGQFGVQAEDYRLDRPEYLGGCRTPIEINQVVQSSISLEGTTKLGDIGGYSLSGGQCGFTYSAKEHGFIHVLVAIRQRHSYQQGIDRQFFRFEKIDFYNPIYAKLGEQPVYTREIFANLTDEAKEDVFGYQEAWTELRQKNSMITGQMRSSSNSGFDVWHFGDEYENAPVLQNTFTQETEEYVDRTISIDSTVSNQFLLDVFFDAELTRVLPTYSIPEGLK